MLITHDTLNNLSEAAENHILITQAQERLNHSSGTVSLEEVMRHYGISQSDLDNIKEPEIE